MEIRPFKACRYNPDVIADLAAVISPPYDKISWSRRQELLDQHVANYVRVILGPDIPAPEDWYQEAAQTMRNWLTEGIMQRDQAPAYYVLQQDFTDPLTAIRRSRRGFMGLLRLPDHEGSVLPHEQTFAGPKADRLQLMRTMQGCVEPIWVLYSDPRGVVLDMLSSGAAQLAATTAEDHLRVTVEAQCEPVCVQQLAALLDNQQLFIADGHHRFETACTFRDECRQAHPEAGPDAPWEFMLVYFGALEDEHLCILPTHRVLHHGLDQSRLSSFQQRLREFFSIRELAPGQLDDALQQLLQSSAQTAFVWTTKAHTWLCSSELSTGLKSLLPGALPEPVRQLDVTILHRVVLEKLLGLPPEEQGPQAISFHRESAEVQQALEAGASGAFLLRPTPAESVRAVASAGGRMPQKSTDFFPKIPSGLVAWIYD